MPSTSTAVRPTEAHFGVQGRLTSLVISPYQDRIAVFVSQDGCLGTIFLVTREEGMGSRGDLGWREGDGQGARVGQAGEEYPEEEDAEEESGAAVPPHGGLFSASVLLGRRDEPLLEACAKSIAQRLSSLGERRPLLIALGLRDHSLPVLQEVSRSVLHHMKPAAKP